MSYRNVLKSIVLVVCPLFVLAQYPFILSSLVHAQSYPTKPVRIINGSTAGGGTDIISRLIGEKLAEVFRQPFIVENRPGASTTIAGTLVARATPDGHTLLLGTSTVRAVAPHIYKVAYDAQRDFAPVALLVIVPNVLIVNPGVPAKNVRELVALVRATPQQFTMGNAGAGTIAHLSGEAFKQLTGLKTVNVSYKGSAPALVDLVAGHIQFAFDSTSSSMGQIKSGRVRPLAVTTARRVGEMPEVPTMAESGFPGFEFNSWYGLWSTGGTPRPILARLHEETIRVLKLPDVAQRLAGFGGELATLTREQFDTFSRAEYERYGKLVREAGIKVQE
ncbi:MAG TPA: tripartite tricarboxylate transporter substrate binding protein [Burkholderiales bacterium]|nr:tripartite tricarboxylate transporter substrate binding protein [Burkholderiales bacterium]